MILYEWATRWGIPFAAIRDLEQLYGVVERDRLPVAGLSEAAVQANLFLEGSRKDYRLFRNNVGVLKDDTGRPVRYGLGNESPQVNKVIKSGDIIGIRKVLILPQHVGFTIGQFVSIEAKESAWSYSHTEREQAQLNWIQLITANGGHAMFANREGLI